MMLVGGVLNGQTVLQPQFTNSLLGYNAPPLASHSPTAGSPLVVMMPLADIATARISRRYLAAFGFIMLVITFPLRGANITIFR